MQDFGRPFKIHKSHREVVAQHTFLLHWCAIRHNEALILATWRIHEAGNELSQQRICALITDKQNISK
jgi:ABC-type nitrate/sulfonate/bicarbonate transport system ATPase subunit